MYSTNSCFRLAHTHRLLICCIFSGPCLYVWLNLLSTVDTDLYDQYKFGCISMAVSCIIELAAETPTFVAQVFCFVKLRVVLDTLNILVRSTIFIWLVLRDPGQAIFAFSIAQIGSTVAFVVGYYAYFAYYFNEAHKQRAALKRDDDRHNDNDDEPPNAIHSDELIPLDSIRQLLPGVLPNPVSSNWTPSGPALLIFLSNAPFIVRTRRAHCSTRTCRRWCGASSSRASSSTC